MSYELIHADCLHAMKAMADDSVDMTITSPPYTDQRTYGIAFKLSGQGWVDWCAERIVEMCRVTAGIVFFNAAGPVRDFQYQPVVEWLVADLTRKHGIVCGPAPYVFHRVGIPGSGGPHYHRRDWEPIYCFAKPTSLPPRWSDNTATGHPPKWAPLDCLGRPPVAWLQPQPLEAHAEAPAHARRKIGWLEADLGAEMVSQAAF